MADRAPNTQTNRSWVNFATALFKVIFQLDDDVFNAHCLKVDAHVSVYVGLIVFGKLVGKYDAVVHPFV